MLTESLHEAPSHPGIRQRSTDRHGRFINIGGPIPQTYLSTTTISPIPFLMSVPIPINTNVSLTAPPHIHALLDRLHARSLAQEEELKAVDFMRSPARFQGPDGQRAFDELMADKFIALEQDKCLFVYNLLRANNAKTVVEIGTSFGVSTVYLALAVGQNHPGGGAKVIATEYEKEKVKAARGHWEEAGEDVVKVIELREGDLRETLKDGLPDEIDFLLLDSECLPCRWDLSAG